MYVYGLFTDDGELRYVGSTVKNLRERFLEHVRPSSVARERNYKNNWLKGLASLPYIQPIHQLCSESDLRSAEAYWITFFKAAGCRLVNTSLGDGSSGHKLTISHKKAISQAQTGRVRTESELALNRQNQQTRKSIKDNLGRTYNSIREAARKLNIDKSHISQVLNGKRLTAGGLSFTGVS